MLEDTLLEEVKLARFELACVFSDRSLYTTTHDSCIIWHVHIIVEVGLIDSIEHSWWCLHLWSSFKTVEFSCICIHLYLSVVVALWTNLLKHFWEPVCKLGSFHAELFLALIEVDVFVLWIVDELLIQNDEAIALETLIPKLASQVWSFSLCQFFVNEFAT